MTDLAPVTAPTLLAAVFFHPVVDFPAVVC